MLVTLFSLCKFKPTKISSMFFTFPFYKPISNRNAFPSLNKILIHIRLMYFFKKDEDVSGNSHVQFIKTIHFLWNQLDGDSILQEMCRRTFTLMPDEPIELFIGFYLPLLIFCSFWQVYNTQAKHIQVRFECIDFMRKNKERFQAVSVLIICNSHIKTCQIDLFFFSFFFFLKVRACSDNKLHGVFSCNESPFINKLKFCVFLHDFTPLLSFLWAFVGNFYSL